MTMARSEGQCLPEIAPPTAPVLRFVIAPLRVGKAPLTCHCEAPQEPRQSRSTQLDDKRASANSRAVAGDSHVASLLGMTNLGALRGRRSHSITCQPARRSLGAATDAIGWYVFIGTLYELEVPSRDCHVGLRPLRNDTGGRHSQACHCAPPNGKRPPSLSLRGSAGAAAISQYTPEHRKAPANSQVPT